MRSETREALAARDENHITQREREVIGLVARGFSNKDIASELGLAPATVKAHLGSIYVKLKLKGRVRLALFAIAPPSA